ncbi:Abi family protein [Corynebacterium sp. H127]|uniref:Abi family protein n=1 Tax=Corynebacterium sp. H127 TaxID=3133418 RepID=UPI00309617A9
MRKLSDERFQTGTHFADAISLYEADRKLRTLVHDAIERVEVCLRTQLSNQISVPGGLAYLDAKNFRASFDHENWLRVINGRVKRARRQNTAIKHYESQYGGRFPLWVLAEVLDSSDISKLFDGLHFADQREIAENLGFIIDVDGLTKSQRKKITTRHPLAAWLEQLTVVRNTAAHHARMWNKSFVPAPTTAFSRISGLDQLPEGQSEKTFGALLMLAFILESVSPHSSWKLKVKRLLQEGFEKHPFYFSGSMGLPEIWDESPIWCS